MKLSLLIYLTSFNSLVFFYYSRAQSIIAWAGGYLEAYKTVSLWYSAGGPLSLSLPLSLSGPLSPLSLSLFI